ncbi:armadillo-type fold-containing protein [Anabaenopsis sp. FSS-46]|uniref:armadillo-type fold-containing protein n=1 Tax=Anabaenopsis sp. FSS-46 TaxID=2971766 RepID=UPI00247371D3|nr:armadillo-type fold-containing protein [Anabaenopsis sp. FSS-46]MDH6099370.1 armadillo-type fold-containing protein [Anabaenopsis sp. FSS-46]
MAKASFFIKVITQILQWLPGELKTSSYKQLSFQVFSGPGGILGFLTIVLAMLLWNWKLLLALVVGVGVMLLVYSMQKWDWQLHLSQLWRLLNSSNSRFALAVGSGGIATVTTYMAAAIWVDSKSSWIATGAIVQGLATLLTLVLLMWQILSFYGTQQQNNLDQLLVNLTVEDPLQRLITIRQITKIIAHHGVDRKVQQEVIQCLQLLLSQEQETVIKDAVLDSLQALDGLQALASSPVKPLRPLSSKSQVTVSSSGKLA